MRRPPEPDELPPPPAPTNHRPPESDELTPPLPPSGRRPASTPSSRTCCRRHPPPRPPSARRCAATIRCHRFLCHGPVAAGAASYAPCPPPQLAASSALACLPASLFLLSRASFQIYSGHLHLSSPLSDATATRRKGEFDAFFLSVLAVSRLLPNLLSSLIELMCLSTKETRVHLLLRKNRCGSELSNNLLRAQVERRLLLLPIHAGLATQRQSKMSTAQASVD